MRDSIRINGRAISEASILREMQYHPAPSAAVARQLGAVALSVRELLLQEADRLGIAPNPPPAADGGDDDRIQQLLERELRCPEPGAQECRTWYENNRQRFLEPARYRVSHILRPAPPDDDGARAQAYRRCQRLVRVLARAPERFGELARRHSRCPSAASGGDLGTIGPGQTCPEFEQALDRLPVGALAIAPVATRYGWHVVYLHDRFPGRPRAFGEVQPEIADYLRESVWRRALAQYIRILAGRADVHGIDLEGETSPLVQ